MKIQNLFLLALFGVILSSCSLNPINRVKENLKEQAAEKVAETIIEQATGAEIDFEVDDESVSYTIEDDEGNEISFSSEVEADIKSIEGMGFDIPVPSGLTNGFVQRLDSEGEGQMVTVTFDATGTTAADFFEEIDGILKDAGFTYQDALETGLDAPDPMGDVFLPFVNYEHPDGFNFSIIWGEDTAILGLSKMEA